MSITIADCLRLPSLRNCTVLAGRAGLSHIVNNVTVQDLFQQEVLEFERPIDNNDLILTSFHALRNDPGMQCRHIEDMYRHGDAGIIVFYVGVLTEGIAPVVIETAERLSFPLIMMPPHSVSFYNEVLSEVYAAIFRDREQQIGILDGVASVAGRLPENRRTLQSLLSLISNQLHCTLCFVDRSGTSLVISRWPAGNPITAEEILALARESTSENDLFRVNHQTGTLTLCRLRFQDFEYRNYLLYLLDESNSLTLDIGYQVIDILEMYRKLWHLDSEELLRDSLLPAILEGDEERARLIAGRLHLDLAGFRSLILIRPGEEVLQAGTIASLQRLLLARLHDDVGAGRDLLLDTYGRYVVVCAKDLYDSDGTDWFRRWIREEILPETACTYACFTGVDTLEKLHRIYRLYEQYVERCVRIFPSKSGFSYGDLLFTRRCDTLAKSQDQEESAILLDLLRTVEQAAGGPELLDTMTIYYLDTDESVNRTASLLYVHRNTVKYRLDRVRALTGLGSEDSVSTSLFRTALALRRLFAERDV